MRQRPGAQRRLATDTGHAIGRSDAHGPGPLHAAGGHDEGIATSASCTCLPVPDISFEGGPEPVYFKSSGIRRSRSRRTRSTERSMSFYIEKWTGARSRSGSASSSRRGRAGCKEKSGGATTTRFRTHRDSAASDVARDVGIARAGGVIRERVERPWPGLCSGGLSRLQQGGVITPRSRRVRRRAAR